MAIINGNDNDNNLFGFEGDDQYFGFGGFDLLFASPGNDTLDGGSDTDVALYNVGVFTNGVFINNTDTAIGSVLAYTVDKRGFGTDTLIDVSNFHGTQFDDIIHVGGSGGTYSFDLGGDDLVVASQTPGADGHFFVAGSGNDTLIGTDSHNDEVDYSDSDGDIAGPFVQGVTVDLAAGTATDGWGDTDSLSGIEHVRGTDRADTIIGNAEGNDILAGAGDDLIQTGDGRDFIEAGAGADTFDGGAGAGDRVDYSRADDDTGAFQGINVSLNTGGGTDANGDTDTFLNIEEIRGSRWDDTIEGDGNRNHLRGEDGDDMIDSFGGTDNSIQGGRGNDTIEARGDGDWVSGGDGNDVITFYGVGGDARPGLGSDTIAGGTDGFFLLDYEGIGQSLVIDVALGATIIGTSGDVDVFSNIPNIRGGDGNDTLLGNDGERQEFFSSGGDDFIDGRGDANDGRDGDRDWLIYNWNDDTTDDTIPDKDRAMMVDFTKGTATGTLAGNDTFENIEAVRTSRAADMIIGSDQAYEEYQPMAGADTIIGGGGIDRLSYTFEDDRGGRRGVTVDLGTQTAEDTFGNADVISGIEQVIGSEFGDTITGDADENLIAGHNGDDTIDGGAGDDSMFGGAGIDIVTGGAGKDAFAGRAWELDGDTWTDFVFEDRIRVYDNDFNLIGANTAIVGNQLEIDTTGDGVAEAVVTLANGYSGQVNSEGGPVGGPIAAVLSIENAGRFSAAVQEGAQTVDITLTRSGDIFSTATVDVTVTGTGPNPADAADITSAYGLPQTVTFLPGETQAVISVEIAADADIEPTEDLAVTLSNVSSDGTAGAELLGAETFIRIINNDFPASVSITGAKALEDSGVLTFTVSRTGDTSQAISVDYRIASAGGIQGAEGDDLTDGLPQSGSVVIEAGASQATFDLAIATDTVAELHDDVVATISAGADWPAGLTVGIAQATGSIRNDDGVPPALPLGATGSNYGDPHILTLDGLAYDFQAVGEFTLIEAVTGDPLDIQVRFQPVDGSQVASQTTAVATTLGTARLVVDAQGSSLVSVDGVAFDIDSAVGGSDLGDGQIFWDGAAITVVHANGEQLRIDVFDGFLSTSVSIAQGRDVQGLLGNADGDATNDLALRDGTILSQPVSFADLYGTYADDWRISDATSLFDYPAGQGTADFTDPGFPAAGVTLDDFPVEVVAAAAAVATAIEDPALKEAAILDYLVTGNTDFVEAAIQIDEQGLDPVAETAPTGAPAIPSGIGISVSDASVVEGDAGAQTIGFTVYRTGDLSDALDVDYSFGGTADTDDYTGPGTGSLSFAAGEASQTVRVEITGDTDVEANEVLEISFAVVGAAVPVVIASTARVTIVNDDLAPDEPELNPVVGTNRNDLLFGTGGDDLIVSKGGKLDLMRGKGGADVFVFGTETTNGRRERDLIVDYETDVDSILLTDGAEIRSIRETRCGVTIRFEGDKDALYIFGRGIDADDIVFITDDSLLV